MQILSPSFFLSLKNTGFNKMLHMKIVTINQNDASKTMKAYRRQKIFYKEEKELDNSIQILL